MARALPDGDAFVWEPAQGGLIAVPHVAHVDLSLLKGIESQRDTLLANTQRFADGLPANNALLWGARGMGKSSLVKAVHAEVNRRPQGRDRLVLIEIHREDIATLPQLLRLLRASKRRFLLFCDDLSFDKDDTSYKSLKAALEGGIEGRPANVLFYATSNRRHLMPRDLVDNERGTAINPGEAVEEKVSLSDRFGLWLGFHNCGQDEYLAMVEGYAGYLRAEDRAGRVAAPGAGLGDGPRRAVGRVAWQFIQDLAGEAGPEARRVRQCRRRSARSAIAVARIDRRGAVADFEMQLRRGDVAGLAGIADHLALGHEIAARHDQPVGMGIGGDIAARMLDQHQIAVILQLVAGIGDACPLAAARMGVPSAAAILMPSLRPPLRVAPKSAITRPDTGQAKAGALPAGTGASAWLVTGE